MESNATESFLVAGGVLGSIFVRCPCGSVWSFVICGARMSCPAFRWAMEIGKALGLPAPVRQTLQTMAELANGENRICWASQTTLADWTGLSIKTIARAQDALEALSPPLIVTVRANSGRSTVHFRIQRDTTIDQPQSPVNPPVARHIDQPQSPVGEHDRTESPTQAAFDRTESPTNPPSKKDSPKEESSLRSDRAREKASPPRKPMIAVDQWKRSGDTTEWGIGKGLIPMQIDLAEEAMRLWALGKDDRKVDWDATLKGWINRSIAKGEIIFGLATGLFASATIDPTGAPVNGATVHHLRPQQSRFPESHRSKALRDSGIILAEIAASRKGQTHV